MYRFVALIWNPVNKGRTFHAQTLARRLRSSSSDWRCVLTSHGLQVFDNGERVSAIEVYRLRGNNGVVLGKLFHRSEHDDQIPVDVVIDAMTSQTIIETEAKHLADEYWGRYVTFLWDESKRRHYVFRDPTGALPCVFTYTQGVSVFMSDLEDYIPLQSGEHSVNWNHISTMFLDPHAITRETGFDGVSQVYAGECILIEDGTTTGSFNWEPARLYESGVLEEPEQAKRELRLVIENCVRGWGSCYGSIIHQLSGGLDSSIIAACLSEARNRADVVCLNLSTEAQEGDERYFARLAAQNAGFELIEGQWRSSDRRLECLLDSRKHATPTMALLYSETDRLLHRLIAERGSEAVFSGRGGDQVFQHRRNPLIAADYIWQNGLRPEFATIVAETSRLTTKSVWNILGTALTYGLLKRKFDYYAVHKRSALLTDEAKAALTPNALVHPWIDSADGLPPGKVQHIKSIVNAQHFHLMPSLSAHAIHPLISQPIIECCLKIPTYVLSRGGVSRALVRDAFRDMLPPEIAARTSKGTTTSYFNRMVVENAQFLREYLLDGMLVSAHILDKHELEKQLSEHALIRGKVVFDIVIAGLTEAWLRSWASVWHRAVA